jgi:hypothetical protein
LRRAMQSFGLQHPQLDDLRNEVGAILA